LGPNTKNSSSNQTGGKVRIIGGRWRSRMVEFSGSAQLRPTSNRIRETVFNWLTAEIHGACCLDLFAGSGALGLEALSRGASSVLFIDKSSQAIKQIDTFLNNVAAEGATTVCADALRFLNKNDIPPFDLLFIDPPFQQNLWDLAIKTIVKQSLVRANGLVYIEFPPGTHINIPNSWKEHRSKTTGSVVYQLFRIES